MLGFVQVNEYLKFTMKVWAVHSVHQPKREEIGVIGDETSAIQPKRQELDPAGRDQRSASTGCCKNLPVDHRHPTMISEEMADQQVHQASEFSTLDWELSPLT